MDLTMFLTSVLSAGGGAGTVGALVLAMYRNAIKKEQEQRDEERRQRDELLHRVDRLEREKIAKLEEKVEKHIEADRSQEILTKLEQLTGVLSKLTDSVQRALELNARQEAAIAAHDIWLKNLNEAVTGKHQPPGNGGNRR